MTLCIADISLSGSCSVRDTAVSACNSAVMVVLRARHAAKAPSTTNFGITTTLRSVSTGRLVIMGGQACCGGIGVLLRRNGGASFFHRVGIAYKGEIGKWAMDSTGGGMFDAVAAVETMVDMPVSGVSELDRWLRFRRSPSWKILPDWPSKLTWLNTKKTLRTLVPCTCVTVTRHPGWDSIDENLVSSWCFRTARWPIRSSSLLTTCHSTSFVTSKSGRRTHDGFFVFAWMMPTWHRGCSPMVLATAHLKKRTRYVYSVKAGRCDGMVYWHVTLVPL